MATEKAMSFSDIQKRLQAIEEERLQLQQALEAKRGEELKVLADAYAKKLEAGGFSILEGVKALAPYDKSVRKRAPKGSAGPRPVRAVETGTTYKDPATGAEWKAGTKGRTVGWLQEYINQGRPASEFVAKGGDLVNNG